MAANGVPMLLTDVIDDCLERIFMYLSVDDLLNIAHTNKQLKPAADEAFSRKFGKTDIQLDWQCRKKKQTFKLLRSFGHLISNITVCNAFHKNTVKVINYLEEYCTESVHVICIDILHRDEWKEVNKPFANVEIVKFVSLSSCNEPNWLNKLFPMVKKFIIDTSYSMKFLEATFHHLEELEIKATYNAKENLNTCLRLNPQMRRLTIGYSKQVPYYFTPLIITEVLRSANQNLNQLEHLSVGIQFNDFSTFNGPFNLISLTSLELFMHSKPISNIPILAPQLKAITLSCNRGYLDSDALIAFLTTTPAATKLDLRGINISIQALTTIAKLLPLLKEVIITSYGFKRSSDVVEFVRMCSSLEMFRFCLYHRTEIDNLELQLGNEWRTSQTDVGLIEIKRNT